MESKRNSFALTHLSGRLLASLSVWLAAVGMAHGQAGDERLLDFATDVGRGQVQAEDGARITLAGPGRDVLELTADATVSRARVVTRAPDGGWDSSNREAVNFLIRNPREAPLVVYANAANPGAVHPQDNPRSGLMLLPGDREEPGYEPFALLKIRVYSCPSVVADFDL